MYLQWRRLRFEERDALLTWLKKLDSHNYLVIRSDYYNRPNNPPIPVLVMGSTESATVFLLHKKSLY